MDARLPIHKKNRLNFYVTEQLVQKCFCIKVSGDHMTAIMSTMINIISIIWTHLYYYSQHKISAYVTKFYNIQMVVDVSHANIILPWWLGLRIILSVSSAICVCVCVCFRQTEAPSVVCPRSQSKHAHHACLRWDHKPLNLNREPKCICVVKPKAY